MLTQWAAADMAGQHGRTALVTGANSGIGFQQVREPARHGACEHAVGDDLPVRVVEHPVAIRAVAAPPAPGPGHQELAAGHGLHGDIRQRQVRDSA